MIGALFWVSAGLVAYVYAGYPILITLAALMRHPRPWPEGPLPKVTLIVAAYNEQAVLAAKLSAILRLDYPRELLQIIVAGDGSNDSTADIARRFSDRGVELVHKPEREGKMAALDRAMTWATGEIIVFSDANNRFRPDAIRHLVAPFSADRVGMTVGYKTAIGDSGLGFSEGAYWKYESHIRSMETRLGCTVGVNGEICSIRRNLLSPAPKGIITDDEWMAHSVIQAGYNVIFCPEAVSHEQISSSAAEENERRSRIVAGRYQVYGRTNRRIPWNRPLVAWMLISHKLLRPLVPLGMIGAALTSVLSVLIPADEGGLLALAGGSGVAMLAAQLVFYGMAAAGPVLQPVFGRLAYVPRFLVDSNVAALRGLWRHLTGGQSAAWVRASRTPQ